MTQSSAGKQASPGSIFQVSILSLKYPLYVLGAQCLLDTKNQVLDTKKAAQLLQKQLPYCCHALL